MSKLCPSAQPGMHNCQVLGVVQQEGPTPRLVYLNQPLAATPDVLALIQRGDPSWEQMVPAAVAEIIKAENLFGWRSRQESSTETRPILSGRNR